MQDVVIDTNWTQSPFEPEQQNHAGYIVHARL